MLTKTAFKNRIVEMSTGFDEKGRLVMRSTKPFDEYPIVVHYEGEDIDIPEFLRNPFIENSFITLEKEEIAFILKYLPEDEADDKLVDLRHKLLKYVNIL